VKIFLILPVAHGAGAAETVEATKGSNATEPAQAYGMLLIPHGDCII